MAKFADDRPSEQPDDESKRSSDGNLDDQRFDWANFGLPPQTWALPQILDKQIWEIAKRVGVEPQESEGLARAAYWATVVKTYQEMGGRTKWVPPTPPENN
jgi:hypothetical protein